MTRATESLYIAQPALTQQIANLLLGFDLVISSSDECLGKLSHELSHTVVNSHELPTTEFTRNRDATFPAAAMAGAIQEATGADKCHFVDGIRLATGWMLKGTLTPFSRSFLVI
ncbi:hypothetical protein GCM10011348_03040 [Marinobacterium nitratireducens]|uniref:HTH lysR-type domain-containing protein n=1 Tax=Marinobacterium nitratireducens TaxID=518897 RepID=A0A917Z699_9GAMM|nr:hypothetical protein GCM10011348_03040 [Marinobacterium nitratireducens]